METEPKQETAIAKPELSNRQFIASGKFKEQVGLALPSHIKDEFFTRVALTALTRNPDLEKCDRMSLAKCLLDCAQVGLPPDGRHAHLIPFKNNKRGCIECQLILDYKGIIALARRSGEVAVIRAELVKENDEFSWENGVVHHKIDFRNDRGKTECVYAYVRFKDGNEDYEVMTKEEVEKVRAKSRAAHAGPWVSDYEEMMKKTAIRRISKRLTLSPEFVEALDKDDDRSERMAVAREVEVKAPKLLKTPEPAQEVVEEAEIEWDGDDGRHDDPLNDDNINE